MDYSAANSALWQPLLQIGLIAVAILFSNLIRRKIDIIRKSLMPTAVIGGFLLLLLKLSGILYVDIQFMEALTYHCIAIGFISMSLRVPEESAKISDDHVGLKSGAAIVSSYLIQGMTGLLVSIGLALAAAGYICACLIGIIILNYLAKKNKLKVTNHEELSGSVTVNTFQAKNEIPIAESLDRLSIQVCLVLVVYLLTYLLIWGLTSLLSAKAPGVGKLVNSLLWGFNFIVGSALAIAVRSLFQKLRKVKFMTRQYQNNYLLSRISGLAFDIMIVAGIASIEPEDLTGLWLPFILMAVSGAIVTLIHLHFVSKRIYKNYYYEGLISMYGMMTGTISSGVLLLREIDPHMETPAANNLVIGSSFGILFGIPMLILIGLAPKSTLLLFITFGCLLIYYIFLMFIIFKKKRKS